jgi:PAS domain S-box-containing protein
MRKSRSDINSTAFVTFMAGLLMIIFFFSDFSFTLKLGIFISFALSVMLVVRRSLPNFVMAGPDFDPGFMYKTMGLDFNNPQNHEGVNKIIITGISKTDEEYEFDPVTENMPNVYFALDVNMRYVAINRAYEKFTGLKAKQVIGKTVAEVIPGNLIGFWGDYQETLETGVPSKKAAKFLLDGATCWYTVDIFKTRHGVSVIMTDITDQKKLEEEAKEDIDRLTQRNKDLTQFGYVLSHNLRSPIAKILGIVSLYENEVDLKINDIPILKYIGSEITNLDNVVKDVNAIMSARDSREHCNDYIIFADQVKLVCQMLEDQIKEANAEIITSFKPDGVKTVKSHLYSIMYNLMSNAIKYRSHERPLRIKVQSRQNEKFIILSVKDNGSGIDLKRFGDKIFGLYKRFHGKEIDGKGIGLNLVKTQAESLGGRVEVKSKVNLGTVFTIYIPKAV